MTTRDPDRVIVVCGFGRCGTSLVMQMLSAAGVRCLGEWPSFECPTINPLSIDPDTMRQAQGGAIKVLDPHRVGLPDGFKYDFVWLTRDPYQQALSSIKFGNALGLGLIVAGGSRGAAAALARSYRLDEPAVLRALWAHRDSRCIKLRFEGLIERTEAMVHNLAESLGLVGREREMVRCVRPRPSSCLPHLLEAELISTGPGGST